jgi:hypothetical protein
LRISAGSRRSGDMLMTAAAEIGLKLENEKRLLKVEEIAEG